MYKIYSFFILILCSMFSFAVKPTQKQISDREYTVNVLYKISEPILRNMANEELKKNMHVDLPSSWNRNKDLAYMEAFGRLMTGLAPWLALPDDDTDEGQKRKQLREWALQGYAHAVNPESPDYLLWRKEGQPLVDAAFIAESFLRAPQQLWEPLDKLTKKRYIEEFTLLRRVNPPYSNWLLFSSIVESFLMSIGEPCDDFRIITGLRKTEEWYVGDSWYSDGEHFAFDYYNSFVIQPMYVEVLEACVNKERLVNKNQLEVAQKRLKRHAKIQERLISPEGTFPAVGRSLTYRTGALQVLSMAAWRGWLPDDVSQAQVRSALTAVTKRMFESDGVFDDKNYLLLGFAGHQPEMADVYTNGGSLYLTSVGFLHLGLPADHPFWTSPAEDWTSKKAWSGQPFPRDYSEK